VVGAVTLLGGLPGHEALECLLQRVPGPAEPHFGRFLSWLYPGRGKPGAQDAYLSPLEPDLLGETLVAEVLSDKRTARGYLEDVFRDASQEALQNGFTVLGRLALRGFGDATRWIESLLKPDVPGRGLAAFEAALTLGQQTAFDPVAEVLATCVQDGGTVGLARTIEGRLPDQTVSLRHVAVWTTETLLADWTDDGSPDTLAKRARLLNNLGVRLSELGRREEALEACQEAVKHYRQLAQTHPDAFLPDLAGSLNNLGNMLSELGRREETLQAAREAVEVYGRLVERLPQAFLQNYVISLGNLVSRLRECGLSPESDPLVVESQERLRRLRGADEKPA